MRNSPESKERNDNPDQKRRTLIKGILAIGGLIGVGAGVNLCQSEQEKDVPEQSVSDDAEVKPDEAVSESSESIQEEIRLPEVTLIDEEITYPKPKEITASDEQYKEASEEFTGFVRSYLLPKLNESMRRFPEYQEEKMHLRGEIFIHFVNEAIQKMEMIPALAPLVKANGGTRDLFEVAKLLQPIFLRGGLYFSLTNVAKGVGDRPGEFRQAQCLELYEVDSTEKAEVTDGSFKSEVPMLILGDRLFDMDEYSGPGRQDTELNMALIYKMNNKPEKMVDMLLEEGVISQRPQNEMFALREYEEGTKKHEAVHVFLEDRFSGFDMSGANFYQVPLNIPMGVGDVTANMSGNYAPVMFSELCAVGNEIAHSESEFPLSHVSYFTAGDEYGYQMLSQLLPVLTIASLKDERKKAFLINQFTQNGSMNRGALAKAVIEDLDVETRKKVGESLYRMGYSFLMAAEKGGLHKASTN